MFVFQNMIQEKNRRTLLTGFRLQLLIDIQSYFLKKSMYLRKSYGSNPSRLHACPFLNEIKDTLVL